MFTESSGNVFEDLGFGVKVSHELKVRSQLATVLKAQIRALNESQAETAIRLGVKQPRVSDLLRGRIDLFSIDTLVSMLGRLNARVNFSIEPQLATETFPASGWRGAETNPAKRFLVDSRVNKPAVRRREYCELVA